jgi:5'-nucleotidase
MRPSYVVGNHGVTMGRMSRPLAVIGATIALTACTQNQDWSIVGQDIHLTLLHTTDIHSRLIPYNLEVGKVFIELQKKGIIEVMSTTNIRIRLTHSGAAQV